MPETVHERLRRFVISPGPQFDARHGTAGLQQPDLFNGRAWFGRDVFVLPEHECAPLLIGAKYRRLAGIQDALHEGCQLFGDRFELHACGSLFSNFLPALLDHLSRHTPTPRLFLYVLQREGRTLKGNARLLSNLAGQQPNTRLIKLSHAGWLRRRSIMKERSQGRPALLLEEGGLSFAALRGQLSQALYIDHLLRHDSRLSTGRPGQKQPVEIYIDAGTALAASALYWGLAQLNNPVKMTVISLAGGEGDTARAFKRTALMLRRAGFSLPDGGPLQIVRPLRAASFGHVPAWLIDEVMNIARTLHMAVDPVYTAKSMVATRDLLNTRNSLNQDSPALYICQAAPAGLGGFIDRLK